MLLALRKLERTCSNKSLWGWRGGAPLYHISKLQHYRSTFLYHMSQLLYYRSTFLYYSSTLPTYETTFLCYRRTVLQYSRSSIAGACLYQQSQMASPLASAFKNLFWWRGQLVGRNSLPSHKKCHKKQGGWQVDDWVKNKICFGVHVPTWQVFARLGSQMKKSWKREPLQLERPHPKSNENLLVKNSSARTSWHSS